MDNYTIFTKTAKGLGETLGKTKNLSREQRKVLKEIDGKASFENLVEQIGMDESRLGAVINKLLADDYIREFGSSAPLGDRPNGETVFGLTAPGTIEAANSQLTIGDFFRAMEQPPAQSDSASLDFRKLGQAETDIARQTLEQTATQVEEIRRAIEEEAQRITARAQQQAAAEQIRRAEEEQARKAAEEAERQARIKAEEQARQLAEEAARREALERARREQAEAQARIKAEEEARLAAEARAREEAAERERARLQAEEEARRVAEEHARQEAEARARREAEEQARIKAQEEEARRLAEEEARKLAQEQARIKAWEAARRTAEKLAQREAEARAKAEAERLAQIRAEEEARLAAEAEARRQAEEAARRAAEEQARREAEEQARQRAAEEARRTAEEKARREAEERAKQEARERARQEAEEAARRKAEEKARQKAEAKARKEAEAQAKRDARREAEEKARREAEEKARQEAERKAQQAAQAKARKEAEEQARREAKEQARQAAAEAARQQEEAAARLKAQQEAEKATAAAAKQVEEEAATSGSTDNAAEATEGQAQHGGDDALDTFSPEAAATDSGGWRVTLPFSLGKLVRVGAVALVMSMIAGLGLLHVVPFHGRLTQLQREASVQFGQPVRIDSLNLSLLPQPHWRLQGVSIGAEKQVVIPQVNAVSTLGGLFSESMPFKSIELVSPVIDEEGLGWILFGQSQGGSLQAEAINVSNARVRLRQLQVPAFDASIELDGMGVWRKIALRAPAEKLHLDLARAAGGLRFELTANDMVLPFGGTLAFDGFNASGTVARDGLDIDKFTGLIYDGTLSGNGKLQWRDGWSLKGEAQARHVTPARLAPGVFQGGALEGKFFYAMQAGEAAKLLVSPQARGTFSINGGALTGVDMASQVMGQAGSGKTVFNELNGDFTFDGGKVKLSRMRLAAGLLSAAGDAAADADGKLSGHVAIDLRTASRQAHSALEIAGTSAEPAFSR